MNRILLFIFKNILFLFLFFSPQNIFLYQTHKKSIWEESKKLHYIFLALILPCFYISIFFLFFPFYIMYLQLPFGMLRVSLRIPPTFKINLPLFNKPFNCTIFYCCTNLVVFMRFDDEAHFVPNLYHF